MDVEKQKTNIWYKKLIMLSLNCVIIFLLLFLIVLHVFFPDRVIEIIGYQAFFVSYTGSMEPYINYNDLIIVKKVDFDDLKEKDIITFYGETTSGEVIRITHEIVEIFFDSQTGEKYLRTKGYSKELPDYIPVTRDGADDTNIYIGKFVAKSEFLGNMFAYIKSPPGLIAIAVGTACVTLMYFVVAKSQNNTGVS